MTYIDLTSFIAAFGARAAAVCNRIAFLLMMLACVLGTPRTTVAEVTRSFNLGFTQMPPVYSELGFNVTYTYLQQQSDLISHTFQYGVPWGEALQSSDSRTFPENVRLAWQRLREADDAFIPNHKRYISIHPINYTYDGVADYWGESGTHPLPWPWNTYAFDNPNVKQAFLNYAIAAVEFFKPAYLGIGVESNILLAKAPHAWEAYKALNAYVYRELKKRYPELKVFTTIQYEHMTAMQADSMNLLALVRDWYPTVLVDEVVNLMRDSDLLAISTYPFMAYGAFLDPSYYNPALSVSARTGRPIAVEQTGYTSETIQIYYSALTGTEALQNQFMAMILNLAYQNQFSFIINFLAIDYGTNYGNDAVSMTWAYTGLWRQDGSPKLAAYTWNAYLGLPYRPK